MMGNFAAEDGELVGQPGLVPQLCKGLFERLHEERSMPEPGIDRTIEVKLSAMEIYNEQVRDLFWRNTPGRTKNTILKTRVHPVEGAFVDGITIRNIDVLDDAAFQVLHNLDLALRHDRADGDGIFRQGNEI